MRHRPMVRARAFTLIESMIVVAIVGILAMVAVVAYKRWIRTAYLSEAYDMVSNIRAAEESYRAENGTYLGVSAGLEPPTNMYPAPQPGAFKTAWGAPCTTCLVQWSVLNIEAKGPVAFGYAVVADNVVSGGSGMPATLTVNGATINVPATTPAYAVEAAGDLNGDGVYTKIYALSGTTELFVDREGE